MTDDLPVYSVPEGSAEDLADLLGVTSRQIREMSKKGLLLKIRRGVYDLRESVKAYYDQGQGKTPSSQRGKRRSPCCVPSPPRSLRIFWASPPGGCRNLPPRGRSRRTRKIGMTSPRAVQGYCEYLRGATKSNQGDLDAGNPAAYPGEGGQSGNIRGNAARRDRAYRGGRPDMGGSRHGSFGVGCWDCRTRWRPFSPSRRTPAEIRDLIMEEVRGCP